MSVRRKRPRRKRLETWLWTGALGHLIGGALDLGEALLRYGFSRARRALARRAHRR
jgi:hypothetical protein